MSILIESGSILSFLLETMLVSAASSLLRRSVASSVPRRFLSAGAGSEGTSITEAPAEVGYFMG